MLVLLGDLANSGYRQEHQIILSELGEMGTVPVFVLPGNHDLTMDTPPETFEAFYLSFGYEQAFARDPESLSYAVMTPAGNCLLMLDTNGWDAAHQGVQHGSIAPHLPDWVRGVIKMLPEGTPVFACGHYPLFPYEGRDSTENAESLVDVLVEAGVKAYFCGHRHSNGTQKTDGLREIMVGVPWSSPAYIGCVSGEGDRFVYSVQSVFGEGSDEDETLRQAALTLAKRMAEGSLRGTAYEDDPKGISWFIRFFMATLDGTLGDAMDALGMDPGYEVWQRAEVKSAVKPWVIETMNTRQEDYHEIRLGP